VRMIHPVAPPKEFYCSSIWMAAWLIAQNHLEFLCCERGTSFEPGVGRLQTIFVFRDPEDRGPQLVGAFVHGNPSANIKKLRDTLGELRAALIQVNNSPAGRKLADGLSRACNPELTGGDDV